MPLYFGHKNSKGLSVSPSLQALKIDLLRASPSAVHAVARPTVTQPGFSSYVNHLPAFMQAQTTKHSILLDKQGYPLSFNVSDCIRLPHPPLVIDYNGPPPTKHVEALSEIGFERIKIHSRDNILRFPAPNLGQVRAIKATDPNTKTPSPVNAVNLDAFEMWILTIRLVSSLLTTHVYPAFRDDGHMMDEIEEMVDELMTNKRTAVDPLGEERSKRQKGPEGEAIESGGEVEQVDIDMTLDATPSTSYVILRRAKPQVSTEQAWGPAGAIPNASGLFFPYVPELASYDEHTVPRLVEEYLFQALGSSAEQQIDRMARLRSSWGLLSKTDSGNVMAHLCKVILLSLSSQGRCFPIIQDGIYQGSVLSGGRLFVGLNGQVYRPLTFDKLQEEAGSYHMHSRVLRQIASIVSSEDELDDDGKKVVATKSLRELRNVLLDVSLTEEERDEVRKLSVHLHFKNDSCLPVNPQSLMRVLDSMSASTTFNDSTLPMHHSALFSRDSVFVALAAFGYQAPSFQIDNCPKVALKDSKPPNTLVIRQKTLDVATMDWKTMMESREIRNNPRNLSRANRDRTLTANDKTMIWGKLKVLGSVSGVTEVEDVGNGGVSLTVTDSVEDW